MILVVKQCLACTPHGKHAENSKRQNSPWFVRSPTAGGLERLQGGPGAQFADLFSNRTETMMATQVAPSKKISEERLIRAGQHGEAQALNTLFRRHIDHLLIGRRHRWHALIRAALTNDFGRSGHPSRHEPQAASGQGQARERPWHLGHDRIHMLARTVCGRARLPGPENQTGAEPRNSIHRSEARSLPKES